MPRLARVVIPGCPHHVTQRGNHRRTVFYTDSERDLFLILLRKYFALWQVQVMGYSLMSNHVHYVLIPATSTSLAKGVGRLHNDFARRQQVQRDLTGHFWQNRFYSCPLDGDYLWEALRCVELNPVRGGLVRNAWDWPWSSARAHVTGCEDSVPLNRDLWRTRFDGADWRHFLEEALLEPDVIPRLRLATRTGRPLGSEEFICHLENLTGRSLHPQKRGPKVGSGSRKHTEFGD